MEKGKEEVNESMKWWMRGSWQRPQADQLPPPITSGLYAHETETDHYRASSPFIILSICPSDYSTPP